MVFAVYLEYKIRSNTEFNFTFWQCRVTDIFGALV